MTSMEMGPVQAGQEYEAVASTVIEGSVQLPKVTKQEEMLYGDLAAVVRLAGSALADLRTAMVWMSKALNEWTTITGQEVSAGPSDLAGLDPHAASLKSAFVTLAGPHDALVTANRRVAEIALKAGAGEDGFADLPTVTIRR